MSVYTSLVSFIDDLRNGFKGNCPTCGRYAKIYSRPINTEMAKMLAEAWQLGGDWRYVHTREIVNGRASAGDYPKLRFWGLIKEKEHTEGEDGKKTSGLWIITEKGRKFLFGEVEVQKYAKTYNNEFLGHEGEMVSFRDCLGQRFDYNDIMKSITN